MYQFIKISKTTRSYGINGNFCLVATSTQNSAKVATKGSGCEEVARCCVKSFKIQNYGLMRRFIMVEWALLKWIVLIEVKTLPTISKLVMCLQYVEINYLLYHRYRYLRYKLDLQSYRIIAFERTNSVRN